MLKKGLTNLTKGEAIFSDYFFVNKDKETIKWIYYNPDGAVGGQYVENIITFDEAASSKNMELYDFFDYLGSVAEQHLYDKNTDEFEKLLSEIAKNHPDYIGINEDVKQALLNDVFSVIGTEAVEICPYCNYENIYQNWDCAQNGYIAKCKQCHKEIYLCDECLHGEDNPTHSCDWHKDICFRSNTHVQNATETKKPKKWYDISFRANCSADDVRAFNNCFFDALNQSMLITELKDFSIRETQE